jgi:hypothetical protein
VTADEVAAELARLGHYEPVPVGQDPGMASPVPPDGNLSAALWSFEEFHGLGHEGSGTERWAAVVALLEQPRCGLPDKVAKSKAGPCRWPHKAIRYHQAVSMGRFSPAEVAEVFRSVWAELAAACGITPQEVQAAAANVAADEGPTGSALAYAYLPCGASESTRLTQVYGPNSGQSLGYFRAVVLHETGHSLGLPHAGIDSAMNPYIQYPRITTLQPGDKRELVARYGPPTAPQPDPTPPPIPPQPGPIAWPTSIRLDFPTGPVTYRLDPPR